MDFEIDAPDAERVFVLSQNAAASAAVLLVVGLILLGFAVFGFLVSAFTTHSQWTLHLTTTLPVLMGIGAIAASWAKARSPREVGVGPAGLRVWNSRGVQTYPWDRVGWSNIERTPMGTGRVLKVYDSNGRFLLRIGDAIRDFNGLAQAVSSFIEAKQDDTAQRIRTTKSKRSAIFIGAVGLAFLALSIALALDNRQQLRRAELLKAAGVPGTAHIERRFLAPNGVTPRLEYRVTTPDGRSATRNVQVDRDLWDALEGAKTIPVIYAPSDPSASRLVQGEVNPDDPLKQPLQGYGIPAAGAVMSLLFVFGAVLNWYGWDIDQDSRTGRISIKRYGTGR